VSGAGGSNRDLTNDLSTAALETALRGRLGRPFRCYGAIGSTNAEALAWAAAGAPEGALVIADHQTEGRGRRGRRWLSRPGSALQFSVVLRPRLPAGSLGRLTTALGVACAAGLERAAAIPVRLKWPNDVTVGGRKVAGILVEARLVAGGADAVVAGIGINVHWDERELPSELRGTATSVSIEMRRRAGRGGIARAELLAAVLEELASRYERLGEPGAFAAVVEEAARRSEVLGKQVIVRLDDGRTLEGLATRLQPSGGLEVDAGGVKHVLEVGEIERFRAAP
jgi:BirA family biotin operon repressor/biotin-[acetyl-CoA-carboxylase] ligase